MIDISRRELLQLPGMAAAGTAMGAAPVRKPMYGAHLEDNMAAGRGRMPDEKIRARIAAAI